MLNNVFNKKYTFLKRNCKDEEFKYDIKSEVGWSTNILRLRIFLFLTSTIFCRIHIFFPFDVLYKSLTYLNFSLKSLL